jgi:hypothetical protein
MITGPAVVGGAGAGSTTTDPDGVAGTGGATGETEGAAVPNHTPTSDAITRRNAF